MDEAEQVDADSLDPWQKESCLQNDMIRPPTA